MAWECSYPLPQENWPSSLYSWLWRKWWSNSLTAKQTSSRLLVKKLRCLLNKIRSLSNDGFLTKNGSKGIWMEAIRQNTPVSSKIYCYIKCANSRLKRYKGKNVSLFQRVSNKRVPKWGKLYLFSKYERRELQWSMEKENQAGGDERHLFCFYLALFTFCYFALCSFLS